jgi:sugar phosphate permease
MKWRVLFLIWLLQFVNYLDRINLSIAAPTMMRDLHITPGGFGLVLAAFTLGYAIMQIPGGWLADRFGSRALLIASPLAWSVFTGFTGMAGSVASLIGVRVLFGLGEGASNGPSFKLVGDWFTSEERSRANGLYLTALALGPAFVAPVAAWLLARAGWQGMFLWFTLPGVAMAGLIWLLVPARPPAVPVAQAERDAPGVGWRDVVARPSSVVLFFAYMAFNVAFWGYLGWMPSYLALSRHIELSHLGFDASLPYMVGFAGMLVFGWLGSGPLYRHRAILVAAGYVLAACALYATFTAETVTGCVAGLSVAAFFLYGGFGPVWAIVLDLTPPGARGAFSGFINCGGQIGGFVAPIVVGYLVSATASFTGGFLFMMAGLVVSALCLAALHPALRRRERGRTLLEQGSV